MATITSVNSVFLLTIPGLFDTPVQLQGWAADDAFASEAVQVTETMMGIDGHLAMGKVNNPRSVSVTLMGDSPSNAVFQAWVDAMEAINEVYPCNGTISLPGPGMTYALRRGILTTYTPFSDVRKVLQPRKYTMVFEGIFGAPVAS